MDHEELATKAGLGLLFVRRLVEAGILPGDEELDDGHLPIARLAAGLDDTGVEPERLAELISNGTLSLEYINRAFVRDAGMQSGDFASLADKLGVSRDFAQDVRLALGVPASDDVGLIRNDDVRTFELLAEMVNLGVSESIVLHMFQIMADSLRKMTRASSEMWKEGVQQPLLEAGLSYRDIVEAQSLNGERLQQIGAGVVQTVWSRYLDDEIYSGTVELLEMALEEAGIERSRGWGHPAVAFMDLTAFTARTDHIGDDAAAADARGLTNIIRRTLVPHRGTLVKMLGDGAMLHFEDPSDAVACALVLTSHVPEAGLPQARFGINSGPIIVKDVDFYGHTVNVAARLVDYARPSEVLVTAELAESVDNEGLSFSEIGPVSLKGVTEPVIVFSASLA